MTMSGEAGGIWDGYDKDTSLYNKCVKFSKNKYKLFF